MYYDAKVRIPTPPKHIDFKKQRADGDKYAFTYKQAEIDAETKRKIRRDSDIFTKGT